MKDASHTTLAAVGIHRRWEQLEQSHQSWSPCPVKTGCIRKLETWDVGEAVDRNRRKTYCKYLNFKFVNCSIMAPQTSMEVGFGASRRMPFCEFPWLVSWLGDFIAVMKATGGRKALLHLQILWSHSINEWNQSKSSWTTAYWLAPLPCSACWGLPV